MGSVIPLKKSVNSAYLDLKNLVQNKLLKVEDLIELKLESRVDLIKKMTNHHLNPVLMSLSFYLLEDLTAGYQLHHQILD